MDALPTLLQEVRDLDAVLRITTGEPAVPPRRPCAGLIAMALARWRASERRVAAAQRAVDGMLASIQRTIDAR